MMRRSLSTAAALPLRYGEGGGATLASMAVVLRCQSSSSLADGSGGGGGRGPGRGEFRLHTHIRDNMISQAQQQSRGWAGQPPPQSTGAADSASAQDWAHRMHLELLAEHDPLGGQLHKDYYRDPSKGYAPQYAPRNFAAAGEIAYHHPSSAHSYAAASQARQWLSHDVEAKSADFEEQREAIRHLSQRGLAEVDQYVSGKLPPHKYTSSLRENQSRDVVDQFQSNGPLAGGRLRQQAVTSRHQAAQEDTAAPLPMTAGLEGGELYDTMLRQGKMRQDDHLDEHLRIEHGIRAKERYEFDVMQRTARTPFKGYDMDRLAAQQQGRWFGARQLPAAVPAGSMEEAQRNLRSNTVPAVEGSIVKSFARNTVADSPKLGEELTEDIVSGLAACRNVDAANDDQLRNQRFGLGRQGPLTQDGGPDKRVLKKNTNDERLVNALNFRDKAYRKTPTDEMINPYLRNSTNSGVGHLLNNKFDIDRRTARTSSGEQDLTERRTFHFGTPLQQTIDEFVFRRRNARGERPLDYFKPLPSFRAMRLNRMYRDTEGFPLMKQRPEFLEWELFTRYRAHHQQRRDLALLHGLEPLPNETAQERDARRAKLDALCEETLFDPSYVQVQDDETRVGVETLRNWFGAYLLPSPSVVSACFAGTGGSVSLHLHNVTDEMGTPDTREHVLSSRYMNRILLQGEFQARVGRSSLGDVVEKAPEPVIKHAQPQHILQHFTDEEYRLYQEYVARETERQVGAWEKAKLKRRWIREHEQYGHIVSHGSPKEVVDVVEVDTGVVLTVAFSAFEKALIAAGPSGTIDVEGKACTVVNDSHRSISPLSVKLDRGQIIHTTDEVFRTLPLESVPADVNHFINFGAPKYSYNRANYVETQDYIWEERTASGEEGWSPATHADGLHPGLPVRVRRQIDTSSIDPLRQQTPSGKWGIRDTVVTGDYQRGVIVEYLKQPFFNPDPRMVTVRLLADSTIQDIPLGDVMVWQRQYYGPERTVGDASRRHSFFGMRRFIDVADPLGVKRAGDGQEHFLDKYASRNSGDSSTPNYRTMKQVTEIDNWNRHDTRRSDNYRPLSISHRRDYVRQGYLHKFTPWEWIAIQEGDQPLIREQIRQDNTGPSYFFTLNRFWRYKARPFGYIKNFPNEIRDMFQFVDGVTPWKQAQKIRTYWEVREHHPMPQFNRPEVALHRNNAALLPSHMWETDKKTGKVKAVKDSVRDYQTQNPVPSWVQL